MSIPSASGSAMGTAETLGERHFVLEIPGLSIGAFSEVSGLTVERDMFEYQEGGMNDYVHKLPGRLKFSNITLKRGITDQDALQQWFFGSRSQAELKDITITLRDTDGSVRRTWAFAAAFPVKWIGPKLSTGSDNAATEELEIAHQGLTRL